MTTSCCTSSGSAEAPPTWVESMGGPLIAVPASVLDGWGGCTMSGMLISYGDVADDYDRACEIDGLAGVIGVGGRNAQGLVLADEPAMTCYLPQHRAFVRWGAADSEAELMVAAEAVLSDPTVKWGTYGVWETDGPAVLMDAATKGAELNIEDLNGGGMPEQAPVWIPAGRWTVRAVHASVDEETCVGLVQLLPSSV
ncbi:Imm21 family immunity protein [Streptomyces sp. NPDC053741]|uniref:Imm21 family immunity protein n=1 Tax=Streptomyces TaxID=1883 RepID=UPI00342E6631